MVDWLVACALAALLQTDDFEADLLELYRQERREAAAAIPAAKGEPFEPADAENLAAAGAADGPIVPSRLGACLWEVGTHIAAELDGGSVLCQS